MSNRRIVAAVAMFCFILSSAAAQNATVSKKQDIAVFALGYYGYDIPLETLATVDAEIQGVFVNLGRFNVLGQTERLSSKDVQVFIDTLKTAKQNNTPLPDEIKFGDVQLTEGVLNKLYGAFVVVIPTIVDYNSAYNDAQKQYETTIKTSVAFVNVAEGTTFGFANIETNGSSKETQYKSIKSAMDGIAFQLTYEIRKIPAFIINTQVLQVKGGEVKMQLGRDMGVQVGDEYVVIEKSELAGLSDEREDGLLLIKNVGPQISTGTILYAGKTLAEGAQLREVPRMGIDFEPYLMYLKYFSPVDGWELGDRNASSETDGALAIGAMALASRGFYDLKPLAGVQINLDTSLWFPIIAYAGLEYDIYIRRLTLSGFAAVAGGTNVVVKMIEEEVSETDEPWFTHYGIKAGAGASVLVSRDMRVFAKVGLEYMLGLADSAGGPFQSFGGYGISAGVAFKL
ncbi:MAG: hypothetical protein A2Z99_20045 [Treponema sp. GWB1_62_6]|nr:MAG: hypothetical protein A2Z99_20045 [Treponema sp. GWB1_62_6]OHE69130.1 MAG: hypothetical protein A2001_12885 [Treponema sp. GWC1_61_84]HCM27070.1 hypothetical protein [Treponema sp.]